MIQDSTNQEHPAMEKRFRIIGKIDLYKSACWETMAASTPGFLVIGGSIGIESGEKKLIIYGAGGLLLDTGSGPSFLPLPPQVLEQVAQNNAEPGVTTLKLPDQTYHRPSDLPVRDVDLELCFVCKKCRMAYPGESPLLAHQRQCYGPNQEDRGAFRIVQVGFECRQCHGADKFKNLLELKAHFESEGHQQREAAPPQSESPLTHEMEDVVKQITLLAARAAQENPAAAHQQVLDTNSNSFCQPAEPKRRFLSPGDVAQALATTSH
ncbi:hypothetical protein GWI33_016612 [Rhynchophorus ferrugineus]|uniref:Uncharacterized protein n=1 Tax=Rhynchophorus ferrugineus TaxID=354439 RepID=A0A834IAT0_RHYFE|nr:hypothetical protein GWI33_016612 [Rhynchophorus ferrugineus]